MHYYLLFLLITTIQFLPALTAGANNITAVYAFGDGFSDTGNNNDRATICFANHKPYGTSFPGKIPTGRFSDAEVAGDILSQYLGLKLLLPAYRNNLDVGEDMVTGVSFASACSGLDDLTALETNVVNLPKQFVHFRKAVEKMTRKVGKEKAEKVVQEAVYLISGGTHDLLNYYVLPIRRFKSLERYVADLHDDLEEFIKALHVMGAMKFAVVGMPPIGCLPFDVTVHNMFSEGKCVAQHNKDAQDYNKKLDSRLLEMQHNLPRTKMAYIDVFSPIMDMVENPLQHGMEVTLDGCCATGAIEMGPTCNLYGQACYDPSKFVFWDAIHPTTAAYRVIAEHIQDQKAFSTLLS